MKLSHITESSLSRLWRHNDMHDCGAITAFRKYHNCGYNSDGSVATGGSDQSEPQQLSRKDNQKRNLALAADLKSLGYGLTKIIGEYPEGGASVKEISYFVVDINDTGNLESDLIKLGEKYSQDSILFAPQGSVQGMATPELIGTNRCSNNWLGIGQREPFAKGKMGYGTPIYTSYVNGRPFVFENCVSSEEIFGSSTNAQLAQKWARDI